MSTCNQCNEKDARLNAMRDTVTLAVDRNTELEAESNEFIKANVEVGNINIGLLQKVVELEAESKALRLDAGLNAIALQHERTLRESCEIALSERDAALLPTKGEL